MSVVARGSSGRRRAFAAAAVAAVAIGCQSLAGLSGGPDDAGAGDTGKHDVGVVRGADASDGTVNTKPDGRGPPTPDAHAPRGDAGMDATRGDAGADGRTIDAGPSCPLSAVITIATGQPQPTNLARVSTDAGTFVYWTTAPPGEGAIVESTTTGPIVQSLGSQPIRGLAISGANVYWTTSSTVTRCALGSTCTGGEEQAFAVPPDASPEAISLIVPSNYFYWTTAQGTVFGTNKSPPNTRSVVATLPGTDLAAIATDSRNLYVVFADFDGAELYFCHTLDSRGCHDAGPRKLAPAARAAIAFDPLVPDSGAPTLFWSSSQAGQLGIFACDVTDAGCAAPGPRKIANPSNVVGLAVDGVYVYWTDGQGGTVLACPVGGCLDAGPITVAADQANPTGLVVDGTFVYWTDAIFGDGGVYKAARPSGCQTLE